MKKLLLIVILLMVVVSCPCYAVDAQAYAEKRLDEYRDSLDPESLKYGWLGGEWLAVALSYENDELFDRYLADLKKALVSTKGVLDERKYTTYSRVILALNALGEDASDFSGYDLYEYLSDYDKVTAQGLTGAVFALIALDNENTEDTVKGRYIDLILSRQKEDGGFGLQEFSEPDVTAMVLISLYKHQDDKKVSECIDRALVWLSENENSNGCFQIGEETSEYNSQVIIALSTLGIDPETDTRFIKNGKTLFDGLSGFESELGYKHVKDGKYDQMATEQAMCALSAYKRLKDKKTPLYFQNVYIEGFVCVM